MYCLLFAVSFSIFAQVISQTPSTYFINPPAAGDQLFFAENQAYAVGSTFDVQWVTDQDAYNIFLWQQSLNVQSAAEGSSPIYTKITGSKEEGGFSWTVSLQQFSLNQSNVFFLALSPAGEQNLNGATTSHYFNVTATSDAASDTTSSVTSVSSSAGPTSTSAPTTTATVTFSPTPVASPSQTAVPAVSSPSTSSTTIGVGVGVGVGLGIPLLLLIGFTLVPRRYRRKLFAAKPPSYANSVDPDNTYPVVTQPAKNYVGELPNSEVAFAATQQNQNAAPVELDGWQLRMSRAGQPPGNRS
ncbi:uncharacterized protein A1O5_12404 [Cladophialophora psammophila CBS 110553]|uniref:Mid2 domain-containing protein n=1 Tax=Cladophialophora psammophila CBS 110553 TaxID=1182543 RepID=W9W034_9EURO|nr:uncharacterized protein A1O5_12404 [Cladophialophora psammophila CBS 110553]EXJ57846.1 hypothetical protein A1O5_12404 [Cladophialophora psammophila CBS 110553]